MLSKIICRKVDYRGFPAKSMIIAVKDDLQDFLSNDSEYNEDAWERMFGKIFYDWSIFAFENGFAIENGFWKWPESVLPAGNYRSALRDLCCAFAVCPGSSARFHILFRYYQVPLIATAMLQERYHGQKKYKITISKSM